MSPLALRGLEGALNRYLQLDPEASERMRALAGKALSLEVRGLGLELCVVFEAGRIGLIPRCPDPPDVRISATPLALLRLLRSGGREDRWPTREASIVGDVEVVRTVKSLAGELDIDWEEQLASVIGDAAAYRLGALARAADAWRRRAGATLLEDLAEYLKEEAELVPSRPELEGYLGAVDTLRDDVDRLESRVRRLLGGRRASR